MRRGEGWGLALLALLAGVACTGRASASAGPPLVTDDPQTPGAGKWEINLAAIVQGGYGSGTVEAPYLDLNYGVGPRLQLKYELGWIINDSGEGARPGVQTALAGVKWRFIDKERAGVSIGTYPQYAFKMPAPASLRAGSGGDQKGFLLPYEFEIPLGAFELNEELGYFFAAGARGQVWFGSAVSFVAAPGLTLLGEIHGEEMNDGTSGEWLFNLGLVRDFNATLTALLSAGRSFEVFAGESPAFQLYAAAQLHI